MNVKAASPDLPDLDLLLAVANTGHVEEDELADAPSVAEWWAGLGPDEAPWPGAVGTHADLDLLRSARLLVRGLGLRNNGVDVAIDAGDLASLPLRLSLDRGPDLAVAGRESLARHVAGRVAVALLRASAHPSWSRVRACANPECAWVYVDGTRNRSRRWCQMSQCGNRAKGAAFRERRRTSGLTDDPAKITGWQLLAEV